jgi:hypothetical protein
MSKYKSITKVSLSERLISIISERTEVPLLFRTAAWQLFVLIAVRCGCALFILILTFLIGARSWFRALNMQLRRDSTRFDGES